MERALRPADGSGDTIGDLVGLADGRRPPLEAASSLLIARLHRKSDDFAATAALSAVSAALARIGWEMPARPSGRRYNSRS